MWKRLIRFSGFKLGVILTLLFCWVKLMVDVTGWGGSVALRFVENIENTLLDLKFKIKDIPQTEEEIRAFQEKAHVVIAAVDEKSTRMEDLGLWPWPRSKTAALITQLNKCGAKAIGFDAVYSEEDSTRVAPAIEKIRQRYREVENKDEGFSVFLEQALVEHDDDKILAAVLEATENVVLGYFFFVLEEEIEDLDRREVIEEGMESIGFGTVSFMMKHPDTVVTEVLPEALGVRSNLQMFTDAVEYYGFFNQKSDKDGIYRSVPMLFAYQPEGTDTLTDLMVFPSLSLQILCMHYGQPANLFIETTDGKNYAPDFLLLLLGPVATVTDKHLEIPLEFEGYFRLNFYGPQKTFRHVSAGDIIHGEEEACKAVDGKLVLVGVTTMGIYDLRPMPFEANYPGVELHATAVENIIARDFLVRPYGMGWYELVVMLGLGLAFSWLLNRFRLTLGLVITVLVWFALVASDFLILFPMGILAHTVLLDVLILLLFLSIAVYRYATEEKQKRETRRAFQFYLSSDVIDSVLEDQSTLKLGGERRELSVLFSDIRGFTTISEGLAPEALTGLLNEYLTPMTELVFKYRGTLDKYMGDAIMAFYGAPVPFEDHAIVACRTALEMMEELARLREGWRERGLPEMDIGIGVNTGQMSVGNMGSENRFDYTVMGDHVNLGSRLEGLNKQYGTHIIVSEFTRDAIGGHFTCRDLDLVAVKGKKEPVRIFELVHSGPFKAAEDGWITEVQQALEDYRAQRFDEAVGVFQKVADERDDHTARMYVQRCQDMKANPPGEAWDGVFTMMTK